MNMELSSCIAFVCEGRQDRVLHQLKFNNFIMVLSDAQLELLALTLDVEETDTETLVTYFKNVLPGNMNIFMRFVMQKPLERNMALRTQPCAWNMLLSRR